MAESEALLTWGGLPADWRIAQQEDVLEASTQSMSSSLQAMASAAQAKDAALLDMQRRLQAALEEVEQGRAKEAALRRRAEIAEAAEEALASQMAELEAEAYASIAQCRELVAQVDQGRARETALLKRAEKAEAAEEALASQMAEIEAEAYAGRTGQQDRADPQATVKPESDNLLPDQKPMMEATELQRQLAAAELALDAAHAKLRQAEEEEQADVTLRKMAEMGPEAMTVAVSLQELAAMVKLRLWSPSVLTLTSASA